MKPNLSGYISVAEQITDGSITIKSIKEFKSILKIFPNDPALQKAYSDLLVKKNRLNAAAKSYDRSAQLFIDSGKILQAIDSKLLQWKIKSPSPKEAQLFYSTLHGGTYYETPLKTFFQRLSYREMIAIVSKLVRVKLPPGKMIRKSGDPGNDLFFIVSGNLKETVFVPLEKKDETLYRKRASYLLENEFFGDIYPFKEKSTSKSYIETTTRSELVRISKSNLIKICNKYPNIELGLIDLYKVRKESTQGSVGQKIRKIGRHQLPLKINLQVFMDGNKSEPLILDGYSRDVSIGGLCVILDGKYKSISSIYKNVKTAKIEMSLPKEELALKVAGTIVWSRDFTWKKRKIVALGFRFKDMSPKFRGMFFMMADSICNEGG
ncbi:MAG: cyclic nucleotide-binding domain-containing protein [Desulfobacterales bacterium]|nr:cyclic nucleotide-binding domain-containing protein [Desulfobacterales bacterium]